jgi:hypothetical protein
VRAKTWAALALLAVAIGLVVFGIHFYRHRLVRSNADLLHLLPTEDETTFFADLSALRHSGLLGVLAGSKRAQDPEYQQFVRDTGFDYGSDLDQVAGCVWQQQLFLVVRGRFRWSSLRDYVHRRGGQCRGELCQVAGTRSGRWVSFRQVQPDVMALAISSDASAAQNIRPKQGTATQPMPNRAVWLRPSETAVHNPQTLPAAVRMFAICLQSAYPITLFLSPAQPGSDAAFRLQVEALCASDSSAETARNQLEIQSKMLQLELAREHQRPNPSDLSGLLTSGTFQVVGHTVVGSWPVRKELLNTIE